MASNLHSIFKAFVAIHKLKNKWWITLQGLNALRTWFDALVLNLIRFILTGLIVPGVCQMLAHLGMLSFDHFFWENTSLFNSWLHYIFKYLLEDLNDSFWSTYITTDNIDHLFFIDVCMCTWTYIFIYRFLYRFYKWKNIYICRHVSGLLLFVSYTMW